MALIRSTLTESEIQRRLQQVDVAVFDIDGCIYPGYTQLELGHLLFSDIIRNNQELSGRWRCASRMSVYGLWLHIILCRRMSSEKKNRILQHYYSHALMGISRSRIQRLLPAVWDKMDPSVISLMDEISNKLPLGIISLGLDVVIGGLAERIEVGKQHHPFLFCYSNRVKWVNDLFAGLESPIGVGASDKAAWFDEACRNTGVSVPLVIGHNSEESELCRIADQQGGLSIGICDENDLSEDFNIYIDSGSWTELAGWFNKLRR